MLCNLARNSVLRLSARVWHFPTQNSRAPYLRSYFLRDCVDRSSSMLAMQSQWILFFWCFGQGQLRKAFSTPCPKSAGRCGTRSCCAGYDSQRPRRMWSNCCALTNAHSVRARAPPYGERNDPLLFAVTTYRAPVHVCPHPGLSARRHSIELIRSKPPRDRHPSETLHRRS